MIKLLYLIGALVLGAIAFIWHFMGQDSRATFDLLTAIVAYKLSEKE